jgi:predicted  nucleic acid-binding Zn-ribbon protein
MKTRVSGVPYEVDLNNGSNEDIVSELSRENFMLHSRNLRLEDEVKYLEERVSQLTVQVMNLKSQWERCPSHDEDDLK